MIHEFVELIPEDLTNGVIYVSIAYNTVAHRCACGCGNEVITPLSPTDWQLTFDGESVTLFPSIGNWNFPCRSHYWIINNQVRWSYRMTDDEIRVGRVQDIRNKANYYQDEQMVTEAQPYEKGEAEQIESTFWSRIKDWFSRAE